MFVRVAGFSIFLLIFLGRASFAVMDTGCILKITDGYVPRSSIPSRRERTASKPLSPSSIDDVRRWLNLPRLKRSSERQALALWAESLASKFRFRPERMPAEFLKRPSLIYQIVHDIAILRTQGVELDGDIRLLLSHLSSTLSAPVRGKAFKLGALTGLIVELRAAADYRRAGFRVLALHRRIAKNQFGITEVDLVVESPGSLQQILVEVKNRWDDDLSPGHTQHVQFERLANLVGSNISAFLPNSVEVYFAQNLGQIDEEQFLRRYPQLRLAAVSRAD